MTFDGGGGVYYGAARTEQNASVISLMSPASNPQPGGAVCVLAGTNAGECRRAIDCATEVRPRDPVQREAAALVTCDWAIGFAPLAENGTIKVASGPKLVLAVCCDPACGGGHQADPKHCGDGPVDEPIIFSAADEWSHRFG